MIYFVNCLIRRCKGNSANAVYWSCQLIDRPSNVSLTNWKRMNGVTINDDMIIDKSIHNSINARSSVLKVCMVYIYT